MFKYLTELKNRILLLVIAWAFTLLACYFYKETLLFMLVQFQKLFKTNIFIPYFIFTNVTEIVSVYIKLITFLSFQIFFLSFTYQSFSFLSTAFLKTEYKLVFFFLKISLIVWSGSTFIAVYLLVPITWNFFFSFQISGNNTCMTTYFEAKLSEYFDFFIMVYYLCVLYSQVFTIIFFLLGYVANKKRMIQKFRKIYYYFFIVFSTLISPPDIFSQSLLSFLVIVFYEIFAYLFIFNNHLTRQKIKTN
jgi:sec-independent protein translocase protein TatC